MHLVNCYNCGKEFKIYPGRAKNKIHNCSKACQGITNSKLHSKKIKTNCTICSKEIFYKQSHFKQIANPTCSRACVSKLKAINNKGQQNPRALKLSEDEHYFYSRVKNLKLRAAAKKCDFDLTYEDLIEIYVRQDKKCFYTNLPFRELKQAKIAYDTLSVDRIDSSKGYTKDNIVLCLNCINMMKADHDLESIKKVFHAIYEKEKVDVENIKNAS